MIDRRGSDPTTPPIHNPKTTGGVRDVRVGAEREEDPHVQGHRAARDAQERVHHQGAEVDGDSRGVWGSGG